MPAPPSGTNRPDKGYATIELEHATDGVYETVYAVEADGGWGMARKKVAEG